VFLCPRLDKLDEKIVTGDREQPIDRQTALGRERLRVLVRSRLREVENACPKRAPIDDIVGVDRTVEQATLDRSAEAPRVQVERLVSLRAALRSFRFCESTFDVTFPLADKQVVAGPNAHPLYRWAAEQTGRLGTPSWNFHKILIGRDGRVIDWFSAAGGMGPKLERAIEAALAAAP